jgi:hypothetical protein
MNIDHHILDRRGPRRPTVGVASTPLKVRPEGVTKGRPEGVTKGRPEGVT